MNWNNTDTVSTERTRLRLVHCKLSFLDLICSIQQAWLFVVWNFINIAAILRIPTNRTRPVGRLGICLFKIMAAKWDIIPSGVWFWANVSIVFRVCTKSALSRRCHRSPQFNASFDYFVYYVKRFIFYSQRCFNANFQSAFAWTNFGLRICHLTC